MSSQLPKFGFGFTLVELLAAVFIFSLIGLGSWQLLNQAIRSEQIMEEKTLRLLEINQGLQLIADDFFYLESIEVRKDQFGKEPAMQGSMGHISFVRLGQLPLPSILGGELQRLSYQLINEGEAATLYRSRSFLLDGNNTENNLGFPLITGIRDLHLEYISQDLNFFSNWPPESVDYEEDEQEQRNLDQDEEVPVAIRLYLDLVDYGEIYRLFEIPAGIRQKNPEVSSDA